MNKQIAVYDNTVSARTYLSYISEQAEGFACIGRDGKLYIRTIGQDIAEVPLRYFQKFEWGEKFKVSRVRYEDGIQLFERGDTTNNTVYISQDNMFIVDQEQIDNIYNQINGLEVYSFEGDSIIDPAIDIGDLLLIDGKYVIYQGSSEYKTKFKASISSKIQTKAQEETTSRVPSQKNINRRVESRIDQVEGKIEQTIEQVDEQGEKIADVTLTVNELNSKISDIADTTTSGESAYSQVSFEKINQSEPVRVEIHPIGTNISYLYPRANLYPSENLFMTVRTLRFLNTTTNEVFDYELPNDLLYYDAENYDEFKLDYNEHTCKVKKKVGYNADGTTYVLDNPYEVEYEYPTIELTDGNYVVSLLGYSTGYLFVRLMSQNIYTTQFVTHAQEESDMKQLASEIDLNVNKLLSDYSTTTEMNALIQLLAEQISLQLSKKVGDDEIISKINMTTESIKILSKLLQLEGYTTINGGFAIDEQGNASIANGTVKIDTSGIQMADGAKIIGGDGVYCNLQFFPPQQYGKVGYGVMAYEDIYQEMIKIYADIPSNFVIQSAYITLRHQPIIWSYYKSITDTSATNTTGYGRNIQIYTDELMAKETIYVDSEVTLPTSMDGIKTNAMGTNGKTFSSTVIEVAKSADLSSYLAPRKQTVFNIGSITNASDVSSITEAYARTGNVTAILNVLGYLKVE